MSLIPVWKPLARVEKRGTPSPCRFAAGAFLNVATSDIPLDERGSLGARSDSGIPPGLRPALKNGIVIASVLAAAYAMKAFYSTAGAHDLLWMLTPTTTLVSWLTGASFELEPGRGYLSRELLFEVAPSCAGINFLIIAFCSFACGFVHTKHTLSGKAVIVLLSGTAAYLLTITANATRIALALPLHTSHAAMGPVTPERIHLCLGVAVYFGFLCASFRIAAWWMDPMHEHRLPLVAVPFGAYLSIVLLAPLLRGAAPSDGFWEHAAITTVVVSLFGGAWVAVEKLAANPPPGDGSRTTIGRLLARLRIGEPPVR